MHIRYLKLTIILFFICFNFPLVGQSEYPANSSFKTVVQDIFGNPIEGAEFTGKAYNRYDLTIESYTPDFEGDFKRNGISFSQATIKTKSDGFVNFPILNNREQKYRKFQIELSYEVKKDGYYSQSGSFYHTFSMINGLYGPNDAIPMKNSTEPITLIKPIDYIKYTFVLTKQGDKLKPKILKFIDDLRLQSYLSDSYLKIQSINATDFKSKKYISFEFVNTNTYNSLKLNKYDIGKVLFDEVVRKILNPLNDNLGKSKEYFGYDLTVTGNTKAFTDESANVKNIQYRFLIPMAKVEKYKNKDLTGQQLIDSSVILMDDERIDLKLQ